MNKKFCDKCGVEQGRDDYPSYWSVFRRIVFGKGIDSDGSQLSVFDLCYRCSEDIVKVIKDS